MQTTMAVPRSVGAGASLGWSAPRRRTLLNALEAGTLDTLEFEAVVFRTGPNRNHLRIRHGDLAAFAASFVGVPFLRDHRVGDVEARAGIVIKSELVGGPARPGRQKQDAPVRGARAIRQTIRLTTQRDMRAFLEGQLDRFSVAWFYDGVICSVCGVEWGACAHKPGRAYHAPARAGDALSGRRVRCELVFINPRGKEVSAVNAPAVEGTGVLKHHSAEMQKGAEKRAEEKQEKQNQESRQHRMHSGSSPSPVGEGRDEVQFKQRSLRIDIGSQEKDMNQGEQFIETVPAAHLAVQDVPDAQDGFENGASAADYAGADPWLTALREQVVDGLLARSGLSSAGMTVVRTALEGTHALSPQRVQRVIEAQRVAEAQLGYAGRAQAGRSTPAGSTPAGSINSAGSRGVVHGVQPSITGMHTAEDEVQSALNWLLGDTRAAMPAPHLRNLRDVYLAVTGDVNFWGSFNPEYARLQSANSGTLTGMAVNALNKAVLLHYDNMITYRWYEPIVHVLPHDGTTQQMQLIHMDGIAALPSVAEGAAYTEATTGDSTETAAFTKYGSYVGITLEMIRRSDIARIQAIPRLLVQAAIRRRSATVAAVFTTNPTMADDATTLFHASHGNSDTTAFSSAAWEAARTRIFEQALPGAGKPLALWPTYCLLPIELYDDALTAFGYGSGDAGKPNAAGTAQESNIYALSRPGDPRPIPIVVPDWTDATDWAYIVDPRLHPVLVMAYANATAGGAHALPEIFEVRSESAGLMFSHDTLPVKIRDWWAFGAATHIGVGRNVVA